MKPVSVRFDGVYDGRICFAAEDYREKNVVVPLGLDTIVSSEEYFPTQHVYPLDSELVGAEKVTNLDELVTILRDLHAQHARFVEESGASNVSQSRYSELTGPLGLIRITRERIQMAAMAVDIAFRINFGVSGRELARML